MTSCDSVVDGGVTGLVTVSRLVSMWDQMLNDLLAPLSYELRDEMLASLKV